MSNPSKFIAVGFLLLVHALSSLYPAIADVPFLRWERGLAQQLVLGGEASRGITKIEFVGTGTTPLDFQESERTSDNFVVYTVMIPGDAPVGDYQIIATKNGLPVLLAGIELSGATTYKVARVPRDLLFVVSLMVLLTAIASSLRARKYSEISFRSTQEIPKSLPVKISEKEPLSNRLRNLPYSSRVKAIAGFENSLFKFLLIREGELIHQLSRTAYTYMPVIGFMAGALAANETQRAGGIAQVGVVIFLTIGLISIIDAFTGIFALFGYWFFSLVFGQISSMGDILMMLSVGLGWVGPILALSVFKNIVVRDFSKSSSDTVSAIANLISTFLGSLLGAGIFFMSQKLLNSVLIGYSEVRNVSLQALVVIAIALFVRGLIDFSVVSREKPQAGSENSSKESIRIVRVNSLSTAFAISVTIFLFALAWIENPQSALIVSGLFSAPYWLLLIRFGKRVPGFFARIPRNVLLEAGFVTAISYVVFRQISSLPLLVDSRSQKFLVYAGIPGMVHALYSVLCDSSQRNREVSA